LTVDGRGESVPAWAEVLQDGTVGGEKPLSVARGLEPLQAPLSLAGRLVGVFRTIIKIPVLAMFHPWKDLALSRTVAFEFIRDNHARHVR
jgi:hypothetical protein